MTAPVIGATMKAMSIRVFVSYRRTDSRHATGRLRAHLAREFGGDNVFYDVDSLAFGEDFRVEISRTIRQVDVVILVIGTNFDVGRLARANDYVRMEMVEALKLDKQVVPVLVDDAVMPDAEALPPELETISYRTAAPLRPDPDFEHDAERLVDDLKRSVERRGRSLPPPPPAGLSLTASPVEPPLGRPRTIEPAASGLAAAAADHGASAGRAGGQAVGMPPLEPPLLARSRPQRRGRGLGVVLLVLGVAAIVGATAVGTVLVVVRNGGEASPSGQVDVTAGGSPSVSPSPVPQATTVAPTTVTPTPEEFCGNRDLPSNPEPVKFDTGTNHGTRSSTVGPESVHVYDLEVDDARQHFVLSADTTPEPSSPNLLLCVKRADNVVLKATWGTQLVTDAVDESGHYYVVVGASSQLGYTLRMMIPEV